MAERNGGSDGDGEGADDEGHGLRFDHRRQLVASLMGAVAHEINNPVQSIMNYAQLLRARVQDPVLEGFSSEIFDEARRISSLVKNLQGLVAGGEAMMTEVAIPAVVEDTLALVGSLLHKDGIRVDANVSAHLPRVTGRSSDLEHLLLTLLMSARRALVGSRADQQIELRCERAELDGDTWVRMCVLDRGDRSSTDELRQDPGVAVVAAIVAEHSGRFDIEREPTGATCFTVELPAVRVDD